MYDNNNRNTCRSVHTSTAIITTIMDSRKQTDRARERERERERRYGILVWEPHVELIDGGRLTTMKYWGHWRAACWWCMLQLLPKSSEVSAVLQTVTNGMDNRSIGDATDVACGTGDQGPSQRHWQPARTDQTSPASMASYSRPYHYQHRRTNNGSGTSAWFYRRRRSAAVQTWFSGCDCKR